jgi:hypothetical protein
MDEEKMASSSKPSVVPITEGSIAAALSGVVTSTATIATAVTTKNHVDVVLVRGGSREGCLSAVNTLSAGGEPPSPGCGAPTLQQMISQVGGSRPGVPQEKLPEFTSVAANATKWAKRGGWLVVKINTQYLIAGDAGESGWVCLKNAPLLTAQFLPHPAPVVEEGKKMPNAD